MYKFSIFTTPPPFSWPSCPILAIRIPLNCPVCILSRPSYWGCSKWGDVGGCGSGGDGDDDGDNDDDGGDDDDNDDDVVGDGIG